jgi:hypothetical protein
MPDESDLAELRELLRTAGVAVAGELLLPDAGAGGFAARALALAALPALLLATGFVRTEERAALRSLLARRRALRR